MMKNQKKRKVVFAALSVCGLLALGGVKQQIKKKFMLEKMVVLK